MRFFKSAARGFRKTKKWNAPDKDNHKYTFKYIELQSLIYLNEANQGKVM